MTRKTVDVSVLRDNVNRMLATRDSTVVAPDARSLRLGLICVLEHVLFMTGNYHGFAYQESELAEPGQLKPDYDDTRRRYL